MGKKTILLVIIGVFSVFLLSSCFMMEMKPIVSGYVQYYDGANFSRDNISVKLVTINSSDNSEMSVKTDSKGFYAFSNVPTLSGDAFYSLEFEKVTSTGTKTTEFEFSSSPFFSAMTTIFDKTNAYLTVKATHTDSSKGRPLVEIKDKDNGKLLFSRFFQWKWEDGTYQDCFDLPYGTYEISLRYIDSKEDEFVKTLTVTFDTTTDNSTAVTFDLAK